MILKRRVALDGAYLDEVDDRIVVKGIAPDEGKYQESSSRTGGRDGTRITNRQRDSLDIKVTFAIRCGKREMAAREEILEAVGQWAAAGGNLTVNYRPERKIYVRLEGFPAAGDPWEWTKDYTITFRAYGIPYWRDVNRTVVATAVGTTGSGTIGINGSVRSAASVELTNLSGANMDMASIVVGGNTMQFAGLAMASGETLVIDRNDEGTQVIAIEGAGGVRRSALDKRNAWSADEFWISPPGPVSFSFSAGGACRMRCYTEGRYL